MNQLVAHDDILKEKKNSAFTISGSLKFIKFLIMRKRYTHTNQIKPFRIRNQFSHGSCNETAHSYDNVDMEDINAHSYDDVDMEDINDDNEFDYEENDVITESSDDNDEEKSNDEEESNNNEEESNNDEEESNNDEEESNNDEEEFNNDEEESNNDEEESNNDEEESNNDEEKSNNDKEESNNDEKKSNNDEEERNNDEEKGVHQIVEALDEDKIPSCDGEFAPYFNNYTTAALFCWLQKHNISTNAYEDLVSIIHNPQFEPIHVVKNV